MVHVDGDVTTCCLDEHLENRLGNLRESGLASIWHGPVVNAWRLAHVEGRFSESGPLCPRCNWRSAGAYPPDKVDAWLAAQGLAPRPGGRQ
jgi:MoaA/NifB/PqqE/SkfB family radical SAM enzyme